MSTDATSLPDDLALVPSDHPRAAARDCRTPVRFDLLVNRCLFVEVKAVSDVHPINKAQLLSYMKLLDIPPGLIINFNEPKLIDGLSRLILPGANLE